MTTPGRWAAGDWSRARVAVHVCSRDRPDQAAVLLQDLAQAVEGVAASVTLYDDSRTEGCRASYRDVCAEAELAVHYFGENDRQALVAHARQVLRPAGALLAPSRSFGCAGWDLAGCRFTAMLHGAMDLRWSTLHLFLDDDIRLVDCRYAGREFTVDTASIGRFLAGAELPTDRLFVAGAPFCGRADIALLEHLDAALVDGAMVDDAPDCRLSAFPAMTTSSAYTHPDSPGISGGFLLTNRLSLRTVPLFRSYNEDWIWIRQLALAGGTIHRLDTAVVHAGDRDLALSLRVLLNQFEGEVFDTAWRLCAEAAMPGEASHWYLQDAIRLCSGRLDATLARASAAAMESVVEMLEQLRAQVRAVPRGCFREQIRDHVERSRQWVGAFASLEAPAALAQEALLPDARPVTI